MTQIALSPDQLEAITNALEIALVWTTSVEPGDREDIEAAYDLCIALAAEHTEERE